MARIRNIKPEFFDDPTVCDLTAEAALVFIGLWCQADRAGRLKDEPRRLKIRLRPMSDCDMDAILSQLHAARLIQRYTVDGSALIQVTNFSRHQRPHHQEPASTLAEPPKRFGDSPKSIRESLNTAGEREIRENIRKVELFGDSPKLSGDLGANPLETETETETELRDSAEPSADASTPVLAFPTIGKGPKAWQLTADYVADLAADYPGLDVLAEARAARAWCVANGAKRKTAKGMPAFLVNWLNRAVQSGRTTGASAATLDGAELERRRNMAKYADLPSRGGVA